MGVSLLVLAIAGAGSLVPGDCAGSVAGLRAILFRDPRRVVPGDPGLLVSPADGTIAEITRLDFDEFLGGPAVRIGIFLSIFNVHINRWLRIASHSAPLFALRVFECPRSAKRDQERKPVDRARRTEPPASAAGRPADRRPDRAADRLQFTQRRGGPTRSQIRYDQARFAHRTDLSRRASGASRGRQGTAGQRRQHGAGPLSRVSNSTPACALWRKCETMNRIRTVAVFPTGLHPGQSDLRLLRHRRGRPRRAHVASHPPGQRHRVPNIPPA